MLRHDQIEITRHQLESGQTEFVAGIPLRVSVVHDLSEARQPRAMMEQIELDLRGQFMCAIFGNLPLRLMHLRDACREMAYDAGRTWSPEAIAAAFNDMIETMVVVGAAVEMRPEDFEVPQDSHLPLGENRPHDTRSD